MESLSLTLNKEPYISVIIPTFKDWDRLILCVDNLMKQTIGINQFEIIIVNNDPADNDYKFDSKYKNLVKVNELFPGSYAARNRGLKIAKGSIIAFTDSDCLPDRDWLLNAIKFFKLQITSRMSGVIKILPLDSNPDYVNSYEQFFAFKQDIYARSGLAATANLFTERKVFDEVGLFDEKLFSGGDHEWCQRADKHDYKLTYNEDCVVYHPARTIKQIFKKTRRLYPNYLKKISCNRSKLYVFLFGLYLLRPSIKMIRFLIIKYKSRQVSVLDALKIYGLMNRIRFVQFKEHYKLMFNGEKERQ